MSISIARPEPLGPANGSMTPRSAVAGSVVGRPASSSAQPSGIGSPRSAARRTWPRAAMLLAMSSTQGARSGPAGTATAIGLVPSRGAREP